MLKTCSLFFVSLVLIACGKNAESPKKDVVQAPLAMEAVAFETSLKLFDFTSEEEEKLNKAADLIKKVIMSDEFKQEILKLNFVDHEGLTNDQIYQRIIEGSETLTPGKDHKMNLELEPYFTDHITVGYTYPTTVRVWINRKYLSKFTPRDATSNLMHEWLHKIGFEHEVRNSPTRRYSVPYAVGYLVKRLAKNYL